MLSGTVFGVGGTVLLTGYCACTTRWTIRLYSLFASSSSSACCAALSKALERTSRADSSDRAISATTGARRPAADEHGQKTTVDLGTRQAAETDGPRGCEGRG